MTKEEIKKLVKKPIVSTLLAIINTVLFVNLVILPVLGINVHFGTIIGSVLGCITALLIDKYILHKTPKK